MNSAAAAGFPIVLTAINARHSHTALGIRCLKANLGARRGDAALLEFTLQHSPPEMAEQILSLNPSLVGLGVYIWNVRPAADLFHILKGVRPDITLVAGGPEVSHEPESWPGFDAADIIIQGEAEQAFAECADAVLGGRKTGGKIVQAQAPPLESLASPYALYTEEDIAHRLVYVEASRGCPFHCAFCLSSLDKQVREFPSSFFFAEMEHLLSRGVRQFKFLDRTFNLRGARVHEILSFFLERWRPEMRLHFEIVPELVNDDLLAAFARFPEGGLHLEAGVQSLSPETLRRIGRTGGPGQTLRALARLRTETGALIHADLIAGLPGEDLDSFAAGFDRLMALQPHELQLGILKRLRGAPVAGPEFSGILTFNPAPPYEILRSDAMDFETLQRVKRTARFVDLYHNSGQFPESLPLMWRNGESPFKRLGTLGEKVWRATGKTHELSLATLACHLHAHLLGCGVPEMEANEAIIRDFHRKPGRKNILPFMNPGAPPMH